MGQYYFLCSIFDLLLNWVLGFAGAGVGWRFTPWGFAFGLWDFRFPSTLSVFVLLWRDRCSIPWAWGAVAWPLYVYLWHIQTENISGGYSANTSHFLCWSGVGCLVFVSRGFGILWRLACIAGFGVGWRFAFGGLDRRLVNPRLNPDVKSGRPFPFAHLKIRLSPQAKLPILP